tara:strand:- start:508 stop:741 length:234 start_codon:yes stop_codon:yes gene_type:complete
MGIFGIALRGLGKALLKKGKKSGKDAAKTFKARREVLRGASARNKLDQDVKKTVKDVKKASERADKFSKDIKKKYGG